jgi:transketolase
VLIPSDPIEASLLTRYLTKSVAPSYLRLGKSNEKIINNGTPIIEYGKFNEIVQGGAGTFLFVGSVGTIVLNAADMLRKQGSEISVASAPFLTSMDKEFLVRAAEKGPIITIEEHSRRGGFGSSLLEFLNKENIQAKVGIVAAEQKNLSQIGSQEFLRDQNSINESNILAIFKVLLED